MFKSKLSIIALLIVIIVLFSGISTMAGEHVTKKGFLAAGSKELLKKGLDIYFSGDHAAFNRLLRENPYIFIMKAGVSVHIVETSWTMIRIRPVGETWSVWTMIEGVD